MKNGYSTVEQMFGRRKSDVFGMVGVRSRDRKEKMSNHIRGV